KYDTILLSTVPSVVESLSTGNVFVNDHILVFQFFDSPRNHFALRDGGFLLVAHRHAGNRPREQLSRALTGRDDELERVGEFAAVNHKNVLTMVSAVWHARGRRARSAMTIPRSRSTAAVSSSLTMTKSYSENAAT